MMAVSTFSLCGGWWLVVELMLLLEICWLPLLLPLEVLAVLRKSS
jgi:hypothetical protein